MPGHDDATYAIEVDTDANRLYLTLEGMLDAAAGNEAIEALEETYLPQLEPGFDMVNDISEFEPVSQEAVESIERGKEMLDDAGVSAVVRVMGESVIGRMQFERHGDDGYHTTTAESREQAEAFLDRFREEEG